MPHNRPKRRVLLATVTVAAFVVGGAGLAYAGPSTPDRSTERAEFDWQRVDWPTGVPKEDFRGFVKAGDGLLAVPRPDYGASIPGTIYWASAPDEPWTRVTEGRLTGSPDTLWASGPDDIYQTGIDLYHFDGTSWRTSRFDDFLGPIWGSGPDDIYLGLERAVDGHSVGTGRLLRGSMDGWVEERWDQTERPPLIRTIWGSGPDDVYLGTEPFRVDEESGGIYHKRSGEWTKELSGYRITKLTGSGPDDVWALGTAESDIFTDLVLHSDGDGNWTEVVRMQGGFTIDDIAATGSGELLYTETRGIYRARTDGEVEEVFDDGCGVIGTWSADDVVSRCPLPTDDGYVPGLVRGSR